MDKSTIRIFRPVLSNDESTINFNDDKPREKNHRKNGLSTSMDYNSRNSIGFFSVNSEQIDS